MPRWSALQICQMSLLPLPRSLCYQLGICVCSPDGINLRRRVDAFTLFLKAVFPFRSESRTALVSGHFAVKLTAAPLDYEAIVGDVDSVKDIWYHIGLQYQSPWETTFWEVRPVPDLGEVAPDPRRVYVSGTSNFASMHKGFVPFRDAGTISARWYRVEEGIRHLGTFNASPVPLLAHGVWGEARQFWRRRGRAVGGLVTRLTLTWTYRGRAVRKH